ncbi:MAG: hypothetical protein Q8916_02290 [Bacteroidota bacterium]|nr:hypothetical protein [Bacteroidota bacterium]
MTIGSRLPFISKMLYEFDSVDFAVATFRFSIEQVTPHFPGYILHVLFAKLLLVIIYDINFAFVWISILLSVGSVLLLWRAGAALRAERVGLIAAVIWVFLPILWFYGEIATAYVYEAFFATAFLFLGSKLFRNPEKKIYAYLLFISLSLAMGARQSSIIFFAPCLVYTLVKTRQPIKTWIAGASLFLLSTIVWSVVLFNLSGGISQYFAQAGKETVYRSQSILFGNSLRGQLSVIAKVAIYLFMAVLPILTVVGSMGFAQTRRSFDFAKAQLSKPIARFVILVAFPSLLFYLVIYFMKAGYLLNVLPSIVLIGAIFLDQMAIWRAERIKRASHDTLKLTRPLITNNAIRSTAFVVALELILFLTPFPWLDDINFDNGFTRDSLNMQESIVDAKFGGGADLFLNRLFSFNNVHGVRAIDALHSSVEAALKSSGVSEDSLVLLDTWWHRWGYFYLPQAFIYDIRDFPGSDSLWLGASENHVRTGIADTLVVIPRNKTVLLLLREDHPTFASLVQQVHLKRLDLPQYLDIYRITDEHFSFKWKNVRFIKE